MRRTVTLALAALMVVAMAIPALGAPKNKGVTAIDAAPLVALGAVDGILKPGSLDGTVATFGVVGNPSDGTIEHVGGVVVLGAELRNFTIDLNSGYVTGIVNDDLRATLFMLDGLDLRLTQGAADLLGVPQFGGAVVATADISGWDF